MTRVSLREAYDNKDVVAQILSIRDTAESAVDTSEQAVTTANTASEHVDALVPQVEGAVENANSASASAQASAQTVAGYENRLGAVEGDVVQLNTDVDGVESDLNAVTLRVTTVEGQIVTIQGRVTALETADGQNVKLTGVNGIGTLAVLLTDNQDIYGNKKHHGILSTDIYPTESLVRKTPASMASGDWILLYSWVISNVIRGISFTVYGKSEGRTAHYTASGNTSNGSIHLDSVWNGMNTNLKLAYDVETGTVNLFCSSPRKIFSIDMSGISNNDASLAITIGDNTAVTEPVVGDRYAWVVGVTE